MSIKPNPFVEHLTPYATTSQEPWVVTDRANLRKMDWNEGPGPQKFLKELAVKLLTQDEMISWYPDCNTFDLTETLAAYLRVSEMNILTFPGSDVALETLCRTFLCPDERVVVLTPTYEHAFVYIAAMGAQVVRYALEKPFELDTEALASFLSQNPAKAVYLVRPNNPCGYMLDAAFIQRLCADFPQMLVVADEAYIEFSDQPSLAQTAAEMNNLVVLRTFSKAFSLAGLRVGYMIAHHDILKYVSRLRNGKNISMLGQVLAMESLKRLDLLEQHVQDVKRARDWLCERFAEHGIVFYPTQGNFILFEIDNPRQIVAGLKVRGIYVRDRSSAISGCIRVTITDRASTEYFWASLQGLIG